MEGIPGSEPVTELSIPEGQALLYHYTTAKSALEGILPTGNLHLSSYRSMRDPLEYHELTKLLLYRGDQSGRAGRLPLDEAQETLGALRDRMRILSMTRDEEEGYKEPTVKTFGRGYVRPRMWEHYGDQHRGVCLAFDRAAFVDGEFRDSLRELGGTNIGDVEYTPGGFVAHTARVLPDIPDNEEATRHLFGHLETHNAAFWFLKLLDWETEYEFRLILFPEDEPSDEPIAASFGSALKAIVLGTKFDPRRIPEALSFGVEFSVPVVRLDWVSGRPQVEPVTASKE